MLILVAFSFNNAFVASLSNVKCVVDDGFGDVVSGRKDIYELFSIINEHDGSEDAFRIVRPRVARMYIYNQYGPFYFDR